jgi:mono/diheme cytochrome c family protein
VPLALQVVDAQGRAFQQHPNWIQVRPGERRTCDGCHSPRRGGSLNSGNVANATPNAWLQAMKDQHGLGQTMASTRTLVDPTALALKADLVSSDVWADTAQPGVTARPSVTITYDGLATPAPVNGVINYPQHIQPLWTRDRGANTCVTCHSDPVRLDLRGTTAGTGRLTSYEELLVGDPVIDATTGAPVTRLREGVPEIVRGPALVNNSSGAMNAAGIARKSRLTEILTGQTLLAGAGARTAHPNPPPTAPDHATMLNASEQRLLAEWMDLGGQYYNDPFNGTSGVRTVTGLSQAAFESQVLPILRASCVDCHQPGGSSGSEAASFRDNRFILTGDTDGDYNAALAMVSDACNAPANPLLSRPSTVPHPAGASGQTTAVLPVGSAAYNAIASWISSGCTGP